jgi:hypothetical protein
LPIPSTSRAAAIEGTSKHAPQRPLPSAKIARPIEIVRLAPNRAIAHNPRKIP